MKQFWITFFGSIVGVVIASIIVPILFVIMIIGWVSSAVSDFESGFEQANVGVPASGNLVLEMDLRVGRSDQPNRSPFGYADPLSIVELVSTLERAETDNRVVGLFIRANEYGMSASDAEEIHRAIEGFRNSGRFVYVHAQGFEGTSVSNYYAVSGAEQIWQQDTTSFSASGLAGEVPFYGGLLERVEAQAEFIRFLEYKNAPNSYTESGFTDEHREATMSYITSIYDTALSGIAASRDRSLDTVRAFIEAAPHSAEAALEAGMIDQLGHVVDARDAVRDRAGSNAHLVSIEDYSTTRTPMGMGGNAPIIALIEGQGAIVTGEIQYSLLGGEAVIASDSMAANIIAAANNPRVQAIILRVDSPGGSAIASDQIWDAIHRAQTAGKPVIVSMGSAAASGGYYIAAPADYIVANAATLTGSIGVYGGKIYLHDTFGLVGVNYEPVSVGGGFALAYSSQTRWSETQRDGLQSILSDIYDDFTQRVAEGRDIPLARVQEIARGRVWTGEQALELGLVDEIGGLREAVIAARSLANIEDGTSVRLQRFPHLPTGFETFQALFGMSAESAEAAARLNALMALPEVQAAIAARESFGPGAQLRSQIAEPE